MPSFSEQSDKFLEEVEVYLEQGPSPDNQQLKEVVSRLQSNTETAEKAIQLLGTAAGSNHAWQEPFQRCGILEHVLQSLDPPTLPVSVAKQHLRVIGNCVADNDDIREIVTKDLDKIVACLAMEELSTTVLVVLYNLGNDFEPTRIEAANSRLDNTLAEYLAAGKISGEAVEYATDLLTWVTEMLTPDQLEDNTSVQVFNNILKASPDYQEEHSDEFISILIHYLQDPQFQQKVAAPETVKRLLDLLFDFEEMLRAEETEAVFRELNTHTDPNKVVSEEMNVVLTVRLINSISAISASDAFIRATKLESSVVEKVVSKLVSPRVTASTVCVCVILGNLATSDQACIEMVKDMGLHLPLMDILSRRREQAILYTAAGFMRHLAFPEVNRSILGEAGLIETCSHLLTNEDAPVRGEAAAILCKLVSNSFPNIKKIFYEAVPEKITVAQLPGVEVPEHPTILYHLITQALAPSGPLPSTSMKNPMIEIGRTLVTALRYLRRSDAEQDVDAVTRHMLKSPVIARPIARLVRQRFYADARSEGLLGLGLMAQTHEGAVCVVEEMKADDGLLDAIKEFAAEQKGGEESNASAGRNYQNAVVLLHGLAKNGVYAIDTSLRSDVEGLQAELKRLIV
ncbi:ARM repeat-containing protein [Byssothecium circinans]|uniref:ARM repeat-containing protein n=1 Tax=Byssothecium circinans TaxID=147558 RepID=A0A6A5U4I8_9PLEO|nr:ARM repeat-containing protein [Byssothecium circinans]